MNAETTEKRKPVALLGNLVREQQGRPRLELAGDTTEEIFKEAVRRSQAFSWMGCISDQRPEGGAAMDVYLAERVNKPATSQKDVTMAEVLEVFGELVNEYEQHVDLQIHLVQPGDMSADALRRQIGDFCKDGSYKLLWEEELGS